MKAAGRGIATAGKAVGKAYDVVGEGIGSAIGAINPVVLIFFALYGGYKTYQLMDAVMTTLQLRGVIKHREEQVKFAEEHWNNFAEVEALRKEFSVLNAQDAMEITKKWYRLKNPLSFPGVQL